MLVKNRPKLSPTSQTCRQHIWSSTSVTNIAVTIGCPCPRMEDAVLFTHYKNGPFTNLEIPIFNTEINAWSPGPGLQGPLNCSPCAEFSKIFVVWTVQCSGCSLETGSSSCSVFGLFTRNELFGLFAIRPVRAVCRKANTCGVRWTLMMSQFIIRTRLPFTADG